MGVESLIQYVFHRLPELWLRTGEHLMLTGCSTIAALFIGLPLGVLLFKNSWIRNPAMGIIGILQTIPSLAMLVFLLALLKTIGAFPALIALTLYALLPIVRNTLTGLEGVSPEVMEAARGIGMTEYQQLVMVRMPLSTPVIVAGIRTAAVVGVGIATLSAFIGAGGLGQFINRGLALSNTNLILLGAVPAALLALMVDFCIGAFEWGLRPETKRDKKKGFKALLRPIALTWPFFFIFLGIVSFFTGTSVGKKQKELSGKRLEVIRIGTKNFTEQLILGEIMAQLIEARTDLKVKRRFNLGGTMICHGALVNNEIDLYAEYTGTALTAILKQPATSEPKKALRIVEKAYFERFSLKWLRPFGFNNTYAITVRTAEAERKGWNSISEIKKVASTLTAGFTAEFAERPDGYPGLRQAYDLSFRKVMDLDPSLMYQAVSQGEVDVICAFATDGRIAAYNLKTLKDDRKFFPPYEAAPVIRRAFIKTYPEIQGVLSHLAGGISDEMMQSLNLKVDKEKRTPAEVAETFLRKRGLR